MERFLTITHKSNGLRPSIDRLNDNERARRCESSAQQTTTRKFILFFLSFNVVCFYVLAYSFSFVFFFISFVLSFSISSSLWHFFRWWKASHWSKSIPRRIVLFSVTAVKISQHWQRNETIEFFGWIFFILILFEKENFTNILQSFVRYI